MSNTAVAIPKSHNIVIWALRALIGALFLFAAAMKLSGQPMMVQEFDTVGLGQWFRYFTGALELTGGVAVLIPSVSVLGAVLVLLVDIGAFFAQAFLLHMDVIHTIVIAIVICALLYFQRAQLRGLLGR
jgi:putative oxidoreductase